MKYPPGPNLFQYSWMYVLERFDFLRFATRLVRKYGDIVHVQVGARHHFYINNPDYIEKILLGGYKIRVSRPRPLKRTLGRGLITDQGEQHKTIRGFLQPYFQRTTMMQKAQMIVDQAERVCSKWKTGEMRDIAEDMILLTLGVITRIIFGTDFSDEAAIRVFGEATRVVHQYSHQSPASHVKMWLEYLPFIGKFTEPVRAQQAIDKIIYAEIEKRRAGKNFEGADILSVLLKAQKENPDITYLNDRRIRNELFTILVAGHETTASALSWTLYLLSQNPDAERKLHEEIDRVLAGRLPTTEDLPNLIYTRMVFMESMRIYPPVWTLGRRPEGDDVWIGEYQIPNKSMLLLSPYVTHHDERFFPDPERFDPERFTPEEEAKRPRYCYFPFGAGTRKCIGESLAWMEGILALSAICARWRLRLVPGHPIEMEPLISLNPKHGLKMTLERRSVAAPVLS